MNRRYRLIGLLGAATALAVAPAIAQAGHNPNANPNHGSKGKRCTVKRGFVVKGTLASGGFTADADAATGEQPSVTINVTGANRHARKAGVTVPGTYAVSAASDAFTLRLVEFESGESPGAADGNAADKVRIVGKVAYTKKRCANSGYGAVNVRKVQIIDVD